MAARKDKRRQERDRFLELYRALGAPAGDPVSQAIWVILARHGTKEGARGAAQALWSQFVDANEFRAAGLAEIAGTIESHVKNDAMRVADCLRGFLRRFFRDFHTMDFIAALEKTPEGLKKYLADPTDLSQEIALAMFIRLCVSEIDAEKAEVAAAEAPPEGKPDGKVKKSPERDRAAVLDRIRIACAVAAYGTVPSKAKIQAAHKAFSSAWSYSTLPPLPPPPPPSPPKPIEIPEPARPALQHKAGKASRTKAKASDKSVPKSASKAAESPKGAARGGAAKARPRNNRTTRPRSSSKKSSRR